IRAISDAAKKPPARIRAATSARSKMGLPGVPPAPSGIVHVAAASPARLDGTRRHADYGLAGGDVARHHRPGAGPGPSADRDRCAQHGVDPEERAVADHGAVLLAAVEVGGDRAGADVHLLPDLGVAEVAEVMLLGSGSQGRLLELSV